jgi:hypothetical protein
LKNTRDPKEHWDEFISEVTGEIEYSKIVISGHSQGSGHAAYFSKVHPCAGAFFISGPQEFLDEESSWLEEPFLTTNSVALMHKSEEGTADLIRENWKRIASLRCQEVGPFEFDYDVCYSLLHSKGHNKTLQSGPYRTFLTSIDPRCDKSVSSARPCHNSTCVDSWTPLWGNYSAEVSTAAAAVANFQTATQPLDASRSIYKDTVWPLLISKILS